MSVLKRFNGSTWETIGPGITSARFDAINNMIAPQYDSSQTYVVGDYVVQNDKLYRCKTAIGVAEAWAAGHWDEVNLSDGVENLIIISDTQPTSKDNRIWIDPDDTEVVIPTEDEIDELKNILSPIENDTTASQAYTTGQYFLHNGLFCKALTSIASGATFTLNTNYAVTTVADELFAALNS